LRQLKCQHTCPGSQVELPHCMHWWSVPQLSPAGHCAVTMQRTAAGSTPQPTRATETNRVKDRIAAMVVFMQIRLAAERAGVKKIRVD